MSEATTDAARASERARAPEAAGGAHAVAEASDAGLSPRTGEPRRPWYVWAVAALFFVGAVLAVSGLLQMMWTCIDRPVGPPEARQMRNNFPTSSWLNGAVPNQPGDSVRIVLVIAQFALAMTVATLAVIVGHYAWRGFRWPRWWALIALAASATMLMINPLATASIAAIGLGALALWTPPLRRFSARWAEHGRYVPRPDDPGPVFYGPLPRYR